MMYMNPTPTMTQQSSSFMNSVKCDIKQYPTFAGDFDKWPYFKRQVIALAATHGLEDVFDSKYTVPLIGDPDFQLFQSKNRFVYSVWIARISSGMALSILCDYEDEKDGRGVYFKLMDIYECASNMKQSGTYVLDQAFSTHIDLQHYRRSTCVYYQIQDHTK